MRRFALSTLICFVLAVALAGVSADGATRRAARLGGDWTRFGYDAARHGAGPAQTGITVANVRRLVRRRVQLPGTADSSPVYLRGVPVRGSRHDVFFLTTSYGRTVAAYGGLSLSTRYVRQPTVVSVGP